MSVQSLIIKPPRPRRGKCIVNYDPSGEKFRMLHQVGVDQFGGIWLAANAAAVTGALHLTQTYDPAMRELMSNIVLRVLQRLQSLGAIK